MILSENYDFKQHGFAQETGGVANLDLLQYWLERTYHE